MIGHRLIGYTFFQYPIILVGIYIQKERDGLMVYPIHIPSEYLSQGKPWPFFEE